MDANEFLKTVKPAAQRSRLVPFWADITKLRESGCTLEQVCEFLKKNGVTITIAGLSKSIKRREEKADGKIDSIRKQSVTSTAVELPDSPPKTSEIATSGGKTKTEQVLAGTTKDFSFKQLQKAKDQK